MLGDVRGIPVVIVQVQNKYQWSLFVNQESTSRLAMC